MSKTFISTVLAAALAITSFTAAPARAELTNAEKFLLGAGALVILGTAIEQSQRGSNRKATVTRHKQVIQHQPAPRKKQVKQKRLRPLPAFCLTRVRANDGPRRLFSQRCLQNNYRQVNRLPNRCKTWVQGPRGTRVGYKPRCLRRAGFEIAGR
ncbi:hypothetical protein ACS3SW_11625 [Roseobacteraceae bacterium S113]